ncbi:hypothetical protein [Singulisphaera sp. PoT]|uniref:hypothetical protein n=1 Tax=Singulisphaera sp. PoT TaxID=3411797 RepID=UPI003BF54418
MPMSTHARGEGTSVPTLEPGDWWSRFTKEAVSPDSLEVREPFAGLYPIGPRVLGLITESMKRVGFQASHPITAWGNVVIDGHTRLAAAKAAGVDVLVCRIEFPDEAAARRWAVDNQRVRRNLTDAELLRYIERHDERSKMGGTRAKLEPGQPRAKRNRSSERTAKVLGTSAREVEKVRRVARHASEEDREEIRQGRITVHAVEQKLSRAAWREKVEAEARAMPIWSGLGERNREVLARDVVAYQKAEPRLEDLRELHREFMAEPGIRGRFVERLGEFLSIPDPERWRPCPSCEPGQFDYECRRCKGLGYRLS